MDIAPGVAIGGSRIDSTRMRKVGDRTESAKKGSDAASSASTATKIDTLELSPVARERLADRDVADENQRAQGSPQRARDAKDSDLFN